MPSDAAMRAVDALRGIPITLPLGDFSQAAATVIDRAIAEAVEQERAKAKALAEALRKLRDCDWVISLPDRMDAVRDIARDALKAWETTPPG